MGFISKTELNYSSASVARPARSSLISTLPPASWRFVKFCMVGASGLLVDTTALYLLADPTQLGWNVTLSKICAAEIAMLNNFTWNERWTFRSPAPIDNRPSTRLRRFLIFNIICSIGIGLAVLFLQLFYTWFGWNLYFSNMLAIVLVTCWNFAVNTRWNWRMDL